MGLYQWLQQIVGWTWQSNYSGDQSYYLVGAIVIAIIGVVVTIDVLFGFIRSIFDFKL